MIEINAMSRKGIKDLWNARLVRGATWTQSGNPVVATTLAEVPKTAIGYREARRIHREHVSMGDRSYRVDALVHTYTDDQKFDGTRTGIWADPDGYIELASHFAGACVDFSTYADMPEPLFRWQLYRIRTIEYALSKAGVPVVINARWAGRETWLYSIDELPEHAMLAIGTVASGLRRLENRPVFEAGLRHILKEKNPTHLIVIGSVSCPVFAEAREQGVQVVGFDGETCIAFKANAGEVDV